LLDKSEPIEAQATVTPPSATVSSTGTYIRITVAYATCSFVGFILESDDFVTEFLEETATIGSLVDLEALATVSQHPATVSHAVHIDSIEKADVSSGPIFATSSSPDVSDLKSMKKYS